MTYEIIFYPITYFQRGGVSDRDWIMDRMKFIPENKQQSVSLEYEQRYNREGVSIRKCRESANVYLNNEAQKYYKEALNDLSRTTTEA